MVTEMFLFLLDFMVRVAVPSIENCDSNDAKNTVEIAPAAGGGSGMSKSQPLLGQNTSSIT